MGKTSSLITGILATSEELIVIAVAVRSPVVKVPVLMNRLLTYRGGRHPSAELQTGVNFFVE